MPVIVIANPKGGVGKSTVATQAAGYLASRGHAVMLGDVDRQQSSRAWLRLRPRHLAPIRSWEIKDGVVRPPKGTTHVVLDTPAGLHGERLDDVMKHADKILVPVQPGPFDIDATREFVQKIQSRKRYAHVAIGMVGMRVREGTLSADGLRRFLEGLDVQILGILRDTQNYLQLASRGLTLWDVAPSRVERDLAQWESLVGWLER